MKKRSAANSGSPEFALFLDANFGRNKVAQALRDAGAAVEIHDDHFPCGTPDDEWLKECGCKGWLVISQDQRIRYRKNELEAAHEAGVKLFVLTAANLTAKEAGAILVQALPEIMQLAAKRPAPFVARIARSGNVKVYEKFSVPLKNG